MKLIHTLIVALYLMVNPINANCPRDSNTNTNYNVKSPENCITFSVGQGTGCAWMCNYCANKLGTNNYYFTNGVCSYVPGGCVGSPQVGVDYTCCSN